MCALSVQYRTNEMNVKRAIVKIYISSLVCSNRILLLLKKHFIIYIPQLFYHLKYLPNTFTGSKQDSLNRETICFKFA